MFGMSFFPHNCATNIEVPLEIPKTIRLSRNHTWFASPIEAIGTSPNCPIMKTETKFNDELIRLCSAIGPASLTNVR